MSYITQDNFQSPTQIAWSNKFLAIEVPNLIHKTVCMEKKMPANQGYYYRMSRLVRLPNAMVQLGASGVTPPPITMERVDMDVKPEFYGNHMILTEQCTLLNTDPVLNEGVELLGIQMRTTEDAIIRDALAATTSVMNCTGGVNGDSPTEITRTDVNNITRMLRTNNAKTISSIVGGTNKIGTGPVRNSYVAMCHADLSSDLEGIQGFMNVANYSSQNNILESEVGTAGNLRFLISSEGSVSPHASGNGADVYNVLVSGMEAATVVRQDRYTSKFIHHPAKLNGPMELFDSIAWKMSTACKVVNDLWLVKARATLLN